ncbi:class I SAM-dependent methyltransferase [Rhodococcus coprophilus]|uniref:Methyltransferase n=1 Tax=Rhodococcus coprophilus TaxID=38310 RepID=A0A2X4UC31_9NOCA|nr:methyltransferase [Rhodococcus coprophilus]MBM7457807.1 16S rRNA (guanine1207-N2)-methyltransferase [Rhodococcus coprophilus]SQI30430.1 methyltransferase [Rhodococcus coprophilus]
MLTDPLFDRLRRFPDVEAPNLFAVDAADRLILDEAHTALETAPRGTVVVIDDQYGALTLGTAVRYDASGLRVHQDSIVAERALAANASRENLADRFTTHALDDRLLRGARVVLLRLPRSLSALTEITETIAAHADPDVAVFAGGRDKHITVAMNDVLARSFADVRASRGRQKSRVVIARDPKPGPSTYPVRETLAELDLVVVAHGAAFAGPKLDIGTRFLLEFLPRVAPAASVAVDLGCGTGILSAMLARKHPGLQVIATDQSSAAVASAAATASANGLADRVEVLRDDVAGSLPDASVDLVVCNPPFHIGAAVHTGAAEKMFASAGRILRPGGEMWTVYNSHLRYRPILNRVVGATTVEGRNPKFTVTRSVRNR